MITSGSPRAFQTARCTIRQNSTKDHSKRRRPLLVRREAFVQLEALEPSRVVCICSDPCIRPCSASGFTRCRIGPLPKGSVVPLITLVGREKELVRNLSKKELERLLTETDEIKVYKRLGFLKLLYGGATLAETADDVGVSEGTASNWVERWN